MDRAAVREDPVASVAEGEEVVRLAKGTLTPTLSTSTNTTASTEEKEEEEEEEDNDTTFALLTRIKDRGAGIRDRDSFTAKDTEDGKIEDSREDVVEDTTSSGNNNITTKSMITNTRHPSVVEVEEGEVRGGREGPSEDEIEEEEDTEEEDINMIRDKINGQNTAVMELGKGSPFSKETKKKGIKEDRCSTSRAKRTSWRSREPSKTRKTSLLTTYGVSSKAKKFLLR